MLITLSSKNENNHANFSNYFHDTLVIPQNAIISLISASITTVDGETVITVPANQGIRVMTDIYNIIDYPFPEGTFTLSAFCDAFNRDTNSLYSSILWRVQLEDNDDETVSLSIYRQQSPRADYNILIPWWDDFGYFANFDRNWQTYFKSNSLWKPELGNNIPGIQSPPTAIGSNTNLAGFLGNGSTYNIVSAYNTTSTSNGWPRISYLAPGAVMGQDYRTHNWGDFMGMFYFMTNAHQQATISLTDNKINGDGTLYTKELNNLKCYYEFKANKKLDIHILGADRVDQEIVTDQEYYPGDIFLCRTIGRDWDNGQPGGYNMGLKFKRYTNGGLQLWLPLDWNNAAPGWEYNSGQGMIGGEAPGYNGEGQTFMSTMSGNLPLTPHQIYLAHNWGENKLGWRAGAGIVMDSAGAVVNGGQFIQDEFVMVAPGTTVNVEGGITRMPNGNALKLNRNTPAGSRQRLKLFERNGFQLLPGKTESLNTDLPSLIVFSFRLDSSDGTTGHCILGNGGGGSQQTLELDTAGGATQVQFWDSALNVHNVKFPTINITSGVKYTFGIATHGVYQDTGVFQFKIYIMEENGNSEVLVVPATGGVKDLARIQCIGGKVPETGADDSQFMNGNIWDFRYYQHSEYSHITGTTYWDEVFNNVANHTINTGGGTPDTYPRSWYGALDGELLWAPNVNNDNEWVMLPYGGANQFNNWLVERGAVGVNATGDNWWDFSNMNFSNVVSVKSNLRQELQSTSYGASINAGSGKSIVDSSRLDSDTALNTLKLYDQPAQPVGDYAYQEMSNATFDNFGPVVEWGGNTAVAFANTDNARNINIENLPHRSADGNRHTISRTIYQLPSVMDSDNVGDNIKRSLVVPQKVKIPLNNPSDVILNNLEVRITNEEGVEDDTLVGTSNVVIEIMDS